MRYPLDELLDKKSIVKLKAERIEENRERLQELMEYLLAIKEYINEGICSSKQVEKWGKLLYEINAVTWDLESDIRKGKEEELGLEEVGKMAILIRENNKKRIEVKAEIVETTGKGYKDVKSDHLSE